MKGEVVTPVLAVACASVSSLVVGRSLGELIRNGRLTDECKLRFVDRREVHTASLVVVERREETPRGTRRTLDIKIVDGATKSEFANEEAWAADCQQRKGKKLAFLAWDKIHAWTSDGEDLGSLNDLRRSSSSPRQPEPPSLVYRECEEDEDEDDEGNWHTLNEIMKGEDVAVADEEAMLDEQGRRADAEEPAAADDGSEVSGNNVCGGDGEVNEVGGRSAVGGESNEWAAINGNEVRVFGRPFLGFGVRTPLHELVFLMCVCANRLRLAGLCDRQTRRMDGHSSCDQVDQQAEEGCGITSPAPSSAVAAWPRIHSRYSHITQQVSTRGE
jgi:hypothetical protein